MCSNFGRVYGSETAVRLNALKLQSWYQRCHSHHRSAITQRSETSGLELLAAAQTVQSEYGWYRDEDA